MEKIILFGSGQNASVAYAYFTHEADTLFGLPIVPFEEIEYMYPPDQYKMHIPISYRSVNKLRAEKYDQARAKGYQLASYVSSRAVTWPELVIGDNCAILENSVIQPFATIGNNVTIGCGSYIGHHCVVEDHCYFSARVALSGYITVGAYSFIGTNATVRDGITVAPESVIGAGALILRNTRPRGVYIGNQAQLYPIPSDKLPRM